LKTCIEEHVQPLQDEVKGLKSSIIQLKDELEQTKRLVQPLNDKVIALEDFVPNLEIIMSSIHVNIMCKFMVAQKRMVRFVQRQSIMYVVMK
jgi:hypothetical protein